MCELLGISSNTPDDYKDVLKKFYQHSYDNPHGWGLMYKSENKKLEIVKEQVRAVDSGILEGIIDRMSRQDIVLAHIRYATVGSRKEENCHPFVGTDISGRTWILNHNGTIYSGSMIAKYSSAQKGDTDSERILLYLLDEMNRAIRENRMPLSEKQRFDVVDKIICEITPRNKVNIMIYDGELLYAHKNMKNTLSFKRQGDGIILATKPVDDDNWIPLPMTTLLGFKAGKMIYQGTGHGNVFVSSLENITQFDAMNI